MANKIISLKGFKEKKYISIAKYNVENGTKYFLFDPKNITQFKCTLGYLNDSIAYLHEFVQCMWGNDEIDEYIFFNNSHILNKLDNYPIQEIEINGIKIRYTSKKTIFSRYIFNAVFNINNVDYYIYIKTIENNRFYSIMKDFILNPINN